MEIEAKFNIPTEQVFRELQTISQLADFTLSSPETQNVRDVYFDTATRQVWNAGYAFRRRNRADGTLLTLKALQGGEEAVKRRDETEVFIPRAATEAPDAAGLATLRQRLRDLTGGEELESLFRLKQQRIRRVAMVEGREVAELSIDSVRLSEEQLQRQEIFHVLEVELLPEGTEEELQTLVQRCRDRWSLNPDLRSKLEHAQAFYNVEMPPLPWLQSEREPAGMSAPLSLDALLERYEVDLEHANHVAAQALRLFDELADLHRLPPARRELLRIAALVHNVGETTDHKHRHKVGAKIIRRHPLEKLDAEENCILAVATYLHRKRFKKKKLQSLRERRYFAALSPDAQEEALALAALLRMAVGLETSGTGSTEVTEVDRLERHVDVKVTGPHATKDAVTAEKRADLWRHCFGSHVIFEPPEVNAMNLLTHLLDMPEDASPDEITLPNAPHLKADDTMAEAARKTFLFHFERMLYHEAGTRKGEDIEALHDMRVATRRMRNAARLFDEYLSSEMKPFIKGIKRTNRALGDVRDLDVFWHKTEAYVSKQEDEVDLSQLKAAWTETHTAVRENLLGYLDSKKYRRFKQRFGKYLQSPWPETQPRFTEKGEAVPHRLRHIAPILLYQRLANLRAYEGVLPEEEIDLNRYHRLRIAVKYFRYTLEYFEEILGPDVEALIKKLKSLQDHLGDLQDAIVASNILRDFLLWGTWGDVDAQGAPPAWPSQVVVAPDVVAYLGTRQKEIQHYLETFPEAWAWFQSQAFRQLVADTVAVL